MKKMEPNRLHFLFASGKLGSLQYDNKINEYQRQIDEYDEKIKTLEIELSKYKESANNSDIINTFFFYIE